jgi:Lar family restriction alleviation protein
MDDIEDLDPEPFNLKPCPFCGRTNIEITYRHNHAGPGAPGWYNVMCDCGASLERKGSKAVNEPYAVLQWNARGTLIER